jgi:dienelactone hydrolase
VAWLRAQPAVDSKRIAIFGGSKGAELALLAASRNPAIRAVVAIAPSSVIYQSITGGKQESSSWTAGGKELPYAHYVMSEAFTKSKRLIDLYVPTLAAAPDKAAIRSFDAAGHHVARPPNRPTADSVRLGGTAEGLAAAQRESWRAIIEFLGRMP